MRREYIYKFAYGFFDSSCIQRSRQMPSMAAAMSHVLLSRIIVRSANNCGSLEHRGRVVGIKFFWRLMLMMMMMIHVQTAVGSSVTYIVSRELFLAQPAWGFRVLGRNKFGGSRRNWSHFLISIHEECPISQEDKLYSIYGMCETKKKFQISLSAEDRNGTRGFWQFSLAIPRFLRCASDLGGETMDLMNS